MRATPFILLFVLFWAPTPRAAKPFYQAPAGFTAAEDLPAGLGLRLGRSKSTRKLVQHWNVNFPLDEPLRPRMVISVLAKKSL